MYRVLPQEPRKRAWHIPGAWEGAAGVTCGCSHWAGVAGKGVPSNGSAWTEAQEAGASMVHSEMCDFLYAVLDGLHQIGLGVPNAIHTMGTHCGAFPGKRDPRLEELREGSKPHSLEENV